MDITGSDHVVPPPSVWLLDLCAGIGQLGHAVHAALGHLGLVGRTLCHVERDAAAAALLVGRMAAAELDHAPVWSDLATFDSRPLVGRVGGVCAGLPCPAYSSAGKRGGNADPRAWGEGFDPDDVATWGPVPHAIRIIADCRPGFVFFENVPQWLTSGAFEPVGRELYRLGYTRQESIFVAAEDVGYPHRRERAFVLAVADSDRPSFERRHRDNASAPGTASAGRRCQDRQPAVAVGGGAGMASEELAERTCGGRGGNEQSSRGSGLAPGGGDAVADAVQPRSQRLRSAKPDRRAWSADGGDELGHAERQPAGSGEARSAAVPPSRQSRGPGTGTGGDGVGDAGGEPGRQHTGAVPAEAGLAGEGTRARHQSDGHADAGDALPLYPPPRGTDLAAVADALAQAAALDRADALSPYDRGSASRRVAAAACRMARGIWRDWAAVARLDPSLMPAIEPQVSVVAHGHPYAAADLLRVGGNCVVADAATVAFVTLWQELIGVTASNEGEVAA